jgi:hypothetical protein
VIIGFTGRAQHGKDTSAQVLVEEFGFTRYAFADQLKSMALVLNPIIQNFGFPKHPDRLQTLVALMGWEKAKRIEEVRRFLQVLGTEGVRQHLGDNAWVAALEKRLLEDGHIALDESYVPYPYVLPNAKLTVADVRFPNEAEWISKMGGEVWRIRRFTSDGTSYDSGAGNHASEKFVDEMPVAREIEAYEIESLREQVRAAMAASIA